MAAELHISPRDCLVLRSSAFKLQSTSLRHMERRYQAAAREPLLSTVLDRVAVRERQKIPDSSRRFSEYIVRALNKVRKKASVADRRHRTTAIADLRDEYAGNPLFTAC